MLFLVFAWLGLLATSSAIGSAILTVAEADCFESKGDRLIVAAWLGTILLAISLQAVSLIAPLSPITGLLTAAVLMGISLISKRSRAKTFSFYQNLSIVNVGKLLMAPLVIAAVAVQPTIWYDTGLYHFQVIQWLSQFGAVPGIALLHSRFGFTSSWFSLAAPFNFGPFTARIASLTGGYALLLLTLHFVVCIYRVIKSKKPILNWFIVYTYLFCIPFLIEYWALGTSSSPDVPVIALSVLTAWLLIFVGQHNIAISEGKNAAVLPLLLAAGAATLKVSALPLLLVAFVFYWMRQTDRLKFGIYSVIAVSYLVPNLIFSVVSSGCPLFPIPVCLDLPWAAEKAQAQAMTEIVQQWNRWSGPPPAQTSFWIWLRHWVDTERPTAFLLFSSVLSALLLLFRLKRRDEKIYLLAAAVLGIAYVMYGAPTLRFGLGYFCLLPSLLLAIYSSELDPKMALSFFLILGTLDLWTEPSKTFFYILTVTLTGYVVTLIGTRISNRIQWSLLLISLLCLLSLAEIQAAMKARVMQLNFSHLELFVPPKLPEQKTYPQQVNNVQYLTPTQPNSPEDRCMAAQLPCTPYLLYEQVKSGDRIQLRKPTKGIGAGFIRDHLDDESAS